MSPSTPRILLVEDDAALVTLVTDDLRAHGMSVTSEGRGDRVVARVTAERPDLVVLDIGLPEAPDPVVVGRGRRDGAARLKAWSLIAPGP